MSKELEALKILSNVSYDDYHSCMLKDIHDKELNILEQALTPPTEEEVCKALQDKDARIKELELQLEEVQEDKFLIQSKLDELVGVLYE